jgi:AraC-like DNA-binding protein
MRNADEADAQWAGGPTRSSCTSPRRTAAISTHVRSSGAGQLQRGRGTIGQVTRSAAAAQHLRDLARLRRVRDRIDRDYPQPLDIEALARGAHKSAGHLSREFRLACGESPHSYLLTRRIERAMALLRRGDLGVSEACFAVGCSSLGTFSTRFTELVGAPTNVYGRNAARATAGMPSCAGPPRRSHSLLPRTLGFEVRNDVAYGACAGSRSPPPVMPARPSSCTRRAPKVVQEPTEQPYGIQDCAVRDPAGNTVRIQALR